MSVDTARLQSLEALLFLAAEPLAVEALSHALDCPLDDVTALLTELGQRLEERHSGLVLRNVAGGWRLYTDPVARDAIERHLLAGKSGRLSQAALETLAVIAYKQPISRTEVGDIRGVNADGAVRSLVARGLIEEVGRDDGPGQAVLYGTTTEFLEKIGLAALDDLPPLTDFLPEEPAPDEPAPDLLRAARRQLAAGRELPSTGAARWHPDTDGGDAPEGDAGEDDEVVAARARRQEEVQRRRSQEAEMEELTGALERVARTAMAQLRDVVDSQQDDDDATEATAMPDDEAAAPPEESGP